MERATVYALLLLGIPVVSSLIIDWEVSLGMFLISLVTVRISRNLSQTNKRLVRLAVVLNQAIAVYCLFRLGRRRVVTFPPEALRVDLQSAAVQPRAFVSVVVVCDGRPGAHVASSDQLSQVLSGLQQYTSAVLAKEIVLDAGCKSAFLNAPQDWKIPVIVEHRGFPELTVYVSMYSSFTREWLNGFVREFFANPNRLVVPVTNLESGPQVTSAMIDAEGARLRFNHYIDREVEVPIIAVFSALGVSRTLEDRFAQNKISVLELIRENRLVKLSLVAWFCFEGIRATKFTQLMLSRHNDELSSEFVNTHSWNPHHEDISDLGNASCQQQSGRDLPWLRERFKDWDPIESVKFFIVDGSTRQLCITANRSTGKLELAACSSENAYQKFVSYGGGSGVRSIGETDKCLDAANSKEPGTTLILYICLRGNRNQMFQFVGNRLMWGSYCVTRNEGSPSLVLDWCDESQPSKQQRFLPVNKLDSL